MSRFVAAGEVFSQTDEGAVLPAGVGLAGRAFSEGKAVWSADSLSEASVEFNAVMRDYIIKRGTAR